MKNKRRFFIALIILITILACQPLSNEKTEVATITPRTTSTTPPRPTRVKVKIYNVGEVAEINNNFVVLNSAEIDSKGMLTANFSVENQSSDYTLLRSTIPFTAKDNEGVILEQNQFDCSSHYLDDLSPGEKVKGDICWDVTSSPPFKIYYEDPFVADPLVWLISR